MVYACIYIYMYIRRPRQTQGGARQGIRHLTLVRTTTTSIIQFYRVELHIASSQSSVLAAWKVLGS